MNFNYFLKASEYHFSTAFRTILILHFRWLGIAVGVIWSFGAYLVSSYVILFCLYLFPKFCISRNQGAEIIIYFGLELEHVQIIICGYTATSAVLNFTYIERLTALLPISVAIIVIASALWHFDGEFLELV